MIKIIADPKFTLDIGNGAFALYSGDTLIATSRNARALSNWALEKGALSVHWEGEALSHWEHLDMTRRNLASD